MTARAIVLLDREDDADLKRWTMAAAIVVAAHLGLMATYFLAFPYAPTGAPAPIIIDMVPMAVSPASPVDVAPGPEMQEAPPPPVPDIVEPVPPEPLIEPPPPMIEPLVALPEPPKEPPPPPEVKEEPKDQAARGQARRTQEAGAAHHRRAAIGARHRRHTGRTESRRRERVRGAGVMARPGGRAIAARQALPKRRSVAARAGRGYAQLHPQPRRFGAGAKHRA